MKSEPTTTEPKTYRFRVAISGIELATEHRYTMDEVEDIHRLVKNVAQVAVGDSRRVKAADLQVMPA